MYYLKQLASQAGHLLDLTKIDAGRWIEASRQAHRGNYDPMAESIAAALASS